MCELFTDNSSAFCFFENDGKTYYAAAGTLKSGWQTPTYVDGEEQYYYFDLKTYEAVDGKQTIDGYSFEKENLSVDLYI